MSRGPTGNMHSKLSILIALCQIEVVRAPTKRLLRLLTTVIVSGLVLTIAVVAILGWWSLPAARQLASIPGLSAPIDITFDQDGVPRIRAANAIDAATALGFVHARDRLFQMDMMRRGGKGQLSELLGPATLPFDRTMRVLGLQRRAEIDLASLSPQALALMQAYARGVNAWIGARGRFSGLEFVLLGQPRPWEVVDSLLWGKMMGLWLSSNWRTELLRLSVAGSVSPQILNEVWPPDSGVLPPDTALVPVPHDFPDHVLSGIAGRLLAGLPAFPGDYAQPPSASNEWAVDGRHSATGAPLLAGDPHLAFGQPGIWYLARIETPDSLLVGATAPGVPFLVMGHNGHIAWTFTTTGADVQDIFVETPTAEGGYLTPDGPAAFKVHEERIKVRGRPDDVLVVRETRHGPVISDLDTASGNEGHKPVLAVAMANLSASDTAATGLQALNKATNIEQAGRAADLITSPAQNMLVADGQGIALYVTGRIPVRRSGDGAQAVPGASGEHDWIGMAQGVQLPRFVAPASGRLLNANERVAATDFPVFLGRDWFGDWRARRIRTLLNATDRHTVEGFARMQMDRKSAFAEQVLPAMMAIRSPDGLPAKALALLEGWNGEMAMELPQPLIFNMWVSRFGALLLAKAGIPPAAAGPLHETVAYALTPAGAHWCGGDCTPVLREALVQATEMLAAMYGGDPAAWRWGTAHQAVFSHPVLSRLPVVGGLFSARISVSGDDSTLNRQGGRAPDFDSVHGASYRAVYDLAELDHSRFVIAPGQSGNPLSRHAWDFISRWQNGDTVTLGAVPGRITATLRLEPG